MRNYPSFNRQKGVVIIIALFIVALVATMAYVMMSRLERDTTRTMLLLRNTQAEYYAQGSVAWAMEELRSNWEKQQGKSNVLVDVIPIKSPVNEIDGYKISSTIYDMQSRYNLNNLTKTETQVDFKRLVKAADPKITDQKAEEITQAITDWLSQGQPQTNNDPYYMELVPPYRSPHQMIVDVSELQLIKGMTPSLYAALLPYITALPTTTNVNVQTARAPVLLTLSPVMTLSAAQAIEQLRVQKPILSPQMFATMEVVKNNNIAVDKVTTISNYFLVETEVTIENQRVLLYTLLERIANEGKATTTILWQSKSAT